METQNEKKTTSTQKIITRLVSLGLIIAFFANPKNYWPGAFLGVVMYMSILGQFTGEQIKSRGGFERGGSWAIFVTGIVLSILLATLWKEIGIATYKGLYQFLFCSQGVWGRTSAFEWQIILIFTPLVASWFALDKSSVKEFFASMFFVLILLFVASKFVESEIPKGSLPEQLGITSYDETDLIGLSTDSRHEEKEKILNPKIDKVIDFATYWKKAGLVIGLTLVCFWFLIFKWKEEPNNKDWELDQLTQKQGLILTLGFLTIIVVFVFLIALLGQHYEKWDNLLNDLFGKNYPIVLSFILIGIIGIIFSVKKIFFNEPEN